MPKTKNVEKRIYDVEQFEIIIRGQDGKDVRGDMVIPKQYQAERMTRNSYSVSQWKDKFKEQYPGYDVDVLDGEGNKVRGNTLLSTVRDSYLKDAE